MAMPSAITIRPKIITCLILNREKTGDTAFTVSPVFVHIDQAQGIDDIIIAGTDLQEPQYEDVIYRFLDKKQAQQILLCLIKYSVRIRLSRGLWVR